MRRWMGAACLAAGLVFATAACGGNMDSASGGRAGTGGGGGAGGSGGSGGSGATGGEAGTGGSSCIPRTCAQLGAACGSVEDGCGATLECGSCEAPQTCGGGGTPNRCGCTPESDAALCEAAGATCGSITVTDSCGAERTVADCGPCSSPATCGGGGEGNRCGCTPESDVELCAGAGATCGAITRVDSCGTERVDVECGSCTAPATCGGGGVPNACGCVPESEAELCAAAGATCGTITAVDRCGAERTIDSCGRCTAPGVCGGGGEANTCGCTPEAEAALCAAAAANCGSITVANACGSALHTIESCGTCTAPLTCGGAGVSNACGCVPESDAELCGAAGAQCGPITATDRCGGAREIADCGACPSPLACGAGGEPNVCGCASETDRQLCDRAGAVCGALQAYDACGVVRDIASCGSCAAGRVCGGDGSPGQCAPPPLWTWELPRVGDDLHGVWTFGASDTWMVGDRGAVAHHDGTALAAIDAGTYADLRDVWASGPSDVWVAGENGTLLRYDGSTWRQVATGFDADFRSIAGWGPDDVWVLAEDASGTYFVNNFGGTWARIDPPLLPGERLLRVRGGSLLLAGGTGGLVLDFDPATATFVRMPTGFAADIVGVGSVGTFGIAAARDGSYGWRIGNAWAQGNPPPGWTPVHQCIDLWAQNDFLPTPWFLVDLPGGDEVIRADDALQGAWRSLPLPFDDARALHGGRARGASVPSAWVVGDRGHVASSDGTSFVQVSGDPIACDAVATAGESAWALCGDAIYARQPGGTWSTLPALGSRGELPLRAVWAGGPDDVWVLRSSAAEAAVFLWDGAGWTEMGTFPQEQRALAGTASSVYVAGAAGGVARLDRGAGGWLVADSNAATALHAIAAVGSEVWAVGAGGFGAHFDGATWSARQSVASADLRAIAALDSTHVWAVGAGGAAAWWNGAAWVDADLPAGLSPDVDLTSVHVASATSVWAVAGATGTLFHWDGAAWSVAPVRDQAGGLRAVAGLSTGQMLGVGTGVRIGGPRGN